MKKLLLTIIIICMLLSLSACGTIYSNFRELEQLLVIQTMGLDRLPTGIRLSLASVADNKDTTSSVRLSAAGESISVALEQIQNRSYSEDLFLANINSVLIGEKAAEEDIGQFIEFICRAPNVRIDVPIYIVKGATAEDAVMRVGTQESSISEILQGIQDNLDGRGDGKIFSVAEVAKNTERHGSALICSIVCTEPAESQDKEALAASISGYAVIRENKLCDYLDRDEAIGTSFLTGTVGINNITVKDKFGSMVTLQINSGSSEIKPRWEGEQLTALDISADVSATILEISGSGDVSDSVYEDHLTAQLEAAISDRISAALIKSKTLRADFCGLGSHVERADPRRYAGLDIAFHELLPSLETSVSVKGLVRHTNDIKDS